MPVEGGQRSGGGGGSSASRSANIKHERSDDKRILDQILRDDVRNVLLPVSNKLL